jgi:hypothetical protein
MGINIGRVIGGAMKGYGEGLILDGKQRHEMALANLREQGDNSRAQLQADITLKTAKMREEGDDRRTTQTIGAQKEIAQIKETGDDKRAGMLQNTQREVSAMNNAVVRVDETTGKVYLVGPDGKTKDTGLTGPKGGEAKVNAASAVAQAVKASTDELRGTTDFSKVEAILDAAKVDYDKNAFTKLKEAAAKGEIDPQEAQSPGFWSRLFGGGGGSKKPTEEAAPAGKGDAPPAGKEKPAQYPGAVWSNKANGWVVYQNGKPFLVE